MGGYKFHRKFYEDMEDYCIVETNRQERKITMQKEIESRSTCTNCGYELSAITVNNDTPKKCSCCNGEKTKAVRTVKKKLPKAEKPYLLSVNMNSKLAKGIGIFNLPQGITCPGKTELCADCCYTIKAERMYKAAKAKRKWNLKQSMSAGFVERMITEIMYRKIRMVRFHESGDVYSNAYLNKLFMICRALPEVKFLMYTKSFMYDWSNKPDNLVVYWSKDKTTKLKVPDGVTATLVAPGDTPPVGAVTCTLASSLGPNVKHYCGEHCKICWVGKTDVYFEQH